MRNQIVVNLFCAVTLTAVNVLNIQSHNITASNRLSPPSLLAIRCCSTDTFNLDLSLIYDPLNICVCNSTQLFTVVYNFSSCTHIMCST